MQQDHTPTLLAAGIIAYTSETIIHEAIGHGGVCIATGLKFTVLAPLWMRCSEFSAPVVAAGPAANLAAAALCYAALRFAKLRQPLPALLLWLSFAFNALVACGYLGTGAVTLFGDWPALFSNVTPPILWRAPALLIAAAAYYAALRLAAALFQTFSPPNLLWRRAMLPATGAAITACAAQIAGHQTAWFQLLLALACTLVAGYSLTSMQDRLAPPATNPGPVPRSPSLIAAALVTSVVYIFAIGPGLRIQ